MNARLTSPDAAVATDLLIAYTKLQTARSVLRRKDTPAARQWITDCLEELDRLLDLSNELRGTKGT